MNKSSDRIKKYSKLIGFTFAATGLLLGNINIADAKVVKDREVENNTSLIAQSRPDLFDRTNRRSQKERIAVLDFDYSSVNSPYVSEYMKSRGVSDIMVNRLVKTGQFRVIDRSQLEAIIREQNLGVSGRIDPATAAQIGKLLGVEKMIVGSVTQFNVETKRGGVNVFGFGNSTSDSEAIVQLNVRVIDTKTGEILAVAESTETSTSSDDSVSAFGISTTSSTTNEGKLLGTATVKAVEDIVNQLSSQL